jgi:membrane protease YdiL (CAAX protease family)
MSFSALSLAQTALRGGGAPDWTQMENAWIVGLIYLGMGLAGLVIDFVLLAGSASDRGAWHRRLQDLAKKAWPLSLTVFLVCILIVLHAVGTLLYGLLRQADATTDYTAQAVMMQTLVFHAAGLAAIFFIMRRERQGWHADFGLLSGQAGRDIGMGVLCYLAALPPLLLFSWLYQWLLDLCGHETSMQEVAWVITGELTSWQRVYLVLVAVTVAPLFEELLFRGIGVPVIARRVGMVPAIVITSSVFALLHFHVPSLLPLFVMSTAFALAYIRTESILVPFTMHALFNGVNLSMLIVLRSG